MTRRRAWMMQLHPGSEAEYEAAHRDIWPELLVQMQEHGVSRFVIYRHETTLFAYQERHGAPAQNPNELMQRWWARMQPIMECHPDGRPIQTELQEMFYFDGVAISGENP